MIMTPIELRAAREERGLTQKEMARLLLTGERTYQEWESDDPIGPRQQVNLDLRWERLKRNEERAES